MEAWDYARKQSKRSGTIIWFRIRGRVFKGRMYRGMKANKEYTLEKLDL